MRADNEILINDCLNALEHDRLRNEIVLDNIADGVISAHCNGVIDVFNKACETFFNVKSEDVVGCFFKDTSFCPTLKELFDKVCETKLPIEDEIIIEGLHNRILRISIFPLIYPTLSCNCVVATIRDITEEKAFEERQRAFLSAVSHELKTPITAVKSTAEALIGGAKDEAKLAEQFLASIVVEADRLSLLVDDVLQLAKMDYGNIELKRNIISIQLLIDKVLTMLKPQIRDKQIILEVNCQPNESVAVDSKYMIQAIRNIVENAIKYSPSNSKIIINAKNSNNQFLVDIKDQGDGIPTDEQLKIFDSFYRMDRARSRENGGTGLGLAISKRIIELHGGKINVSSESGSGSVFSIIIPLS